MLNHFFRNWEWAGCQLLRLVQSLGSFFSFLSHWLASTPVASQPIRWCCGWARTKTGKIQSTDGREWVNFYNFFLWTSWFQNWHFFYFQFRKNKDALLKSPRIMKRVRISVISCLSSSYLLWSFHHLLWALNIPNSGIQDHWFVQVLLQTPIR